MHHGRSAGGLALLAALLFAGCGTSKELFLHTAHRENYALQDHEIEGLQFYISGEVLARSVADQSTPEGVVIVPMETPGAATEVGPDWVRVSFQQQGTGVYFLAVKTGGTDAVYWLASEVEGQPGLHALKDLDRKLIRTPQGDFELIYGSKTRLLVNSDDLQKLIETRTHIPGREAPK